MKMTQIEFYNDILIKLDALLTMDHANQIVQNHMKEIEEELSKNAKKYNIDVRQFLKEPTSTRILLNCPQVKMNIPKEYQPYFAGFKKGTLKYHYDPVQAMVIKSDALDQMTDQIIDFKENCPDMKVRDLLRAIQDEKEVLQLMKHECEYMCIECMDGKEKYVFDLYSKRPELPKKSNHIRLVGEDLITDLKEYNTPMEYQTMKKYQKAYLERSNLHLKK